jgi:aspartate-semialdehyde dehydrogenase
VHVQVARLVFGQYVTVLPEEEKDLLRALLAAGAGAKAMAELEAQVRAYAKGEPLSISAFPHQIAFNLIPHIDVFLENGFTKEEMKLLNESRKILGDPEIQVCATTVRVPVFRAHSVSVNVETDKKITVQKARELSHLPGPEAP